VKFSHRCLLVTVLLLGAWGLRARLASPLEATTARPLASFPAVLDPWHGRESPLDAEVMKTAAVDDYLNRDYRSGVNSVGLYVGYYRSQREGEALHSPLNCLPGAGWVPIKTDSIEVAGSPGGATHTVNKLLVEKGLERMLVLYWYQTMNRVTASEYLRKLFLVTDAFGSGRTDVALVRIIAPIDARHADGEAQALQLAHPFAGRVLPQVHRQLFQ
jgi:EpsI family protein